MLFALKEIRPYLWWQIASENEWLKRQITLDNEWLKRHITICEKLWAKHGFRGVGEQL